MFCIDLCWWRCSAPQQFVSFAKRKKEEKKEVGQDLIYYLTLVSLKFSLVRGIIRLYYLNVFCELWTVGEQTCRHNQSREQQGQACSFAVVLDLIWLSLDQNSIISCRFPLSFLSNILRFPYITISYMLMSFQLNTTFEF